MVLKKALIVFIVILMFIANIIAKDIDYWTCSMHPEIRASEKGNCPKCGMFLEPVYLEAKTPVKKSQAEHKEIREEKTKTAPLAKAKDEIDYWTCSMHPSVHKDKAGKCPICGMDLIPLYKSDQGLIVMDERTKTRIGIISQKAELMLLKKQIKIPGRAFSDNDLYMAEQEYLSSGTRPEFQSGAKLKLNLFGFDDNDIKTLESQKDPDKSLISPGEYIWVSADIYENDLKNINRGLDVILTTSAYPEDKFTGKIMYIEPSLDKMTRTAKARIKVKNTDSKLKFEMFTDIEAHIQLPWKITVPSPAVINTGKRTLVYVEVSPGKYKMQEVTVGETAENYTQVLTGLKTGQMVVVQGNFLLDSQSTLQGGQSLQYDSATEIKEEKKGEIKEAPAPQHKH